MAANATDSINNGTASIDEVVVPLPRIGRVNANLHRVSERTLTQSRPANTSKAYDGKELEFIQYLDYVFAHDDFCRKVDANKVYRFIFYQCAREKRLNRRGQRNRQAQHFDKSDYDAIMLKYDFNSLQNTVTFLQPKNGLKLQALRQYKAVISQYYENQKEHHQQGFDFIWTKECNTLVKIVRNRGPEQKLKNFDEKLCHSLSPFTIVHRYPEIEEKLYQQGMSNMRIAVAQLRNRYVLTHTTCGILRFETLEKACLSDFLCIIVKKEEDVHPLLVMVTQVFTGMLTC